MTVPTGLEKVLNLDPEIMHGDLCFVGTRVPLTVWLDNLTEGMGIDEFLKHYPTVQRSQIEAVVRWEPLDADDPSEAIGTKLSKSG